MVINKVAIQGCTPDKWYLEPDHRGYRYNIMALKGSGDGETKLPGLQRSRLREMDGGLTNCELFEHLLYSTVSSSSSSHNVKVGKR